MELPNSQIITEAFLVNPDESKLHLGSRDIRVSFDISSPKDFSPSLLRAYGLTQATQIETVDIYTHLPFADVVRFDRQFDTVSLLLFHNEDDTILAIKPLGQIRFYQCDEHESYNTHIKIINEYTLLFEEPDEPATYSAFVGYQTLQTLSKQLASVIQNILFKWKLKAFSDIVLTDENLGIDIFSFKELFDYLEERLPNTAGIGIRSRYENQNFEFLKNTNKPLYDLLDQHSGRSSNAPMSRVQKEGRGDPPPEEAPGDSDSP